MISGLRYAAGVFFLGRKYGKKEKQALGPEKLSPPVGQVPPFEGVGGYPPTATATGIGFLPVKAEVDGQGVPRHKLPTYELPS